MKSGRGKRAWSTEDGTRKKGKWGLSTEEKKVFVMEPISSDDSGGSSCESESESESESDDDKEIHVFDAGAEESEEEIIINRREREPKYNFIIKQGDFPTVTNPTRPKKTYIPSKYHPNSVLHDLGYPLVVLAKLALARYNEIECKNYQYFALVKAYNLVVSGFIFWIRFKAFLTDQHPIDFEAVVYQRIPYKPKPGLKIRDCDLQIKAVYPLP